MTDCLLPKGDNPTPQTDVLIAKYNKMMSAIKTEAMINEITTSDERFILELAIDVNRRYMTEGRSVTELSNNITGARLRVGKHKYIDLIDRFTEEEFEIILKYVQI
jgi:hypothetical protein